MTSQARIDANRRNAEKSTGPKTEAGKQKVRLNALKNGLAAETVVLPHEDATAFEKRHAAWTRELSPGGSAGDYLAERAVKISWQLDRADKAEHAALAKRVREIPRERERSRRRRATEQVRRILEADPQEGSERPRRSRADRLERLESTLHGCWALLEAWSALEGHLSASNNGSPELVGERVLRLLGAAGLHDASHASDPRLRRLADVLNEDRHRMFAPLLASLKDKSTRYESIDLKANPPDHTAANVALLEVVAEEQQRLMDRLEAHEEEEPNLAAEDAARVAFDTSKEAEVVHRYQNQWGRALLQTFKAIAALRPALAVEPVHQSPVATATEPDQAATEQSQRECDKANESKELGQKTEGWSQSGRTAVASGRPRSATVGSGSLKGSDSRRTGDPAEILASAA